MNTKVRLGKTKPYKCFVIDLEKDSVHNILLTGVTGSGKSTLCHSLLEQLIRQNSPEEVGFVIMDFKRVEYAEYKNSPYLLEPIIYDPDVGLKALEKEYGKDSLTARYIASRTPRPYPVSSSVQAVPGSFIDVYLS